MKLDAIHHVAIIASDYERSRHFYVDLLGFEIIRENYREKRGDHKLDLKLGDCELELFGIPGSFYRDFKAGQSFGTAVTGVMSFFRDFLFPVLSSLCGWTICGCGVFLLLVALWMVFVRRKRRIRMGMVLCGIFFPFLAAAVTLSVATPGAE